MTFQQAVASCLSKYLVFSGRAARSEFWYFVLFSVIGGLIFGLIDSILFGWIVDNPDMFEALFSLAIFAPSVSVAVRRLHDLEKSGWWWWLVIIPLIGWVILIIWYATKGSDGSNTYGPDPLGGTSDRSDMSEDQQSSIPSVPRKS